MVAGAAFGYFQSTRAYFETHGKPVAFYSDKHSIFRISKAGAVQGRGMTQFGGALHELNIDILCANTPQAKGWRKDCWWHPACLLEPSCPHRW